MDNRRMILLMIFFGSSFLLWNAWKDYSTPKPVTATTSSTPAVVGAPPLATDISTSGAPSVAPATGATPSVSAQVPVANQGEIVSIETDLFQADISSVGGSFVGLSLANYKDREDKTKRLMLLGNEHKYRAQNGLTSPVAGLLPDHNTLFKVVSGARSLGDTDKTLTLRLEAPVKDGIKVSKTYTFTRGSYLIDLNYEIENASGQVLNPSAYFQLRRDSHAPAGESRMVSTFTGPSLYTQEGKYQKIDFSDIDKNKAKFVEKADNGWVAMVQHYFVSAWIPAEKDARKFYVRKVEEAGTTLYDAGVIVSMSPIAAGGKAHLAASLYAGPQTQSTLEQLAKPVADGGIGAEGLPRVVDYGWLTIVAAPIFWSLDAIHKIVGNWGWSIIILTIIIKGLFFPLSATSYKSMARMRALTPRLTAMRERCGDDKQKLNAEMMALYRTEKVNPLGGCLPIVIQIPVFVALYWALLGAVEMRDASWALWIHDLSAQDPYYVLPVIMVATMLIQTRLNPTPPDPIQAKVTMIMPFAFGFMFFWFPSGLVLYWIVNNLLSIAQQWQITRMIEKGSQAVNDAKI